MHPAELGELEAFRDFYAAAPPELGARSKEVGGALCVRLEPLSTVTMFNRVIGLGIDEPATEAQLDEALHINRGVDAQSARDLADAFSTPTSPSRPTPSRTTCERSSSRVACGPTAGGRSSAA